LGSTVLDGPFSGLRLVDGFEHNIDCPVLKLVGLYERVLWAPLEAAISARPQVVANVGCADGYYAVGLARRLPTSTVYAFDLAKNARAATRRLATLNHAAARIHVHGRCRRFPAEVELVICDIEGGEYRLLGDPQALARSVVIVETHDHVVSGVTRTLAQRFAATHVVECLDRLVPKLPPTLTWMTESDRRIALDEMRSEARQHWLVMHPRAAQSTG
jgi:hypothetical protein